jgi:hypothetical protein
MIGNVITSISDVDAVMYVVLTEGENQKPYGELLNTAECITL